jgi:hypothetical protein
MEQTECSETSAHKIQTPGNYPEENIQHTEHGESLKSRIIQTCSKGSLIIRRLHFIKAISVLPRNKAVKQLGSPAVFTIISTGHTLYKSRVHLTNMCVGINAKNCPLSATAKYVNSSLIIMNFPILS